MSSALESLLFKLIDYAGLFPPVGLAMRPTISNYRQYLTGSQRWMLARIVIPAGRLDEFEQSASEILDHSQPPAPWQISALVPNAADAEFPEAVAAIDRFNARQHQAQRPLGHVDAIEGKANSIQEIEAARDATPSDCDLFLELPTERCQVLIAHVSQLRAHHLQVKIRTGGITKSSIPPIPQVAEFIHVAATNRVSFKATAGLHHLIRSERNLTYQEDSSRGVMHGFLNVFLAACAAFDGVRDLELLGQILAETDVGHFQIHPEKIVWQDIALSTSTIQRARTEFAVSFGSCSFCEPVDELQQWGVLG